MAISWGSYGSVNGAVRGRTGVELTVSYPGGSLSSGDTTATITGKVYFQLESPYSGSGSNARVEITDDHVQTTEGISWSVGSGGSDLMLTFTDTVSLTYSSQSYSVNARVRGVTTWSFTPTKDLTITIPARPHTDPAEPTSFTAARYNDSDTQTRLTWVRNATAAAPYDDIEIWRSSDGGPIGLHATISGASTSYVDTTTKNHRYGYKIRARNDAGTSPFTTTLYVSTTPATPAAPTAKKDASNNIVVTRPALSSVATSWEVREAGGATLATVAANVSTYLHTAPDPAKAWSYAVRAVSSGPTLYSDWSAASTPVQVIAPPNAPTSMTPAVADAAAGFTATWQHNPVDTTDQTAYEIQYRTVAGGAWSTTGKVASATSSHAFAAGTFANGDQLEWQVRTWGAHATASPWSASAITALSAAPSVSISSPGATVTGQTVTLAWSFSDPEGGEQATWIATLLRDGVAIETRDGSTATTRSTKFATILENGATYAVRIKAKDAAGLWSAEPSVTFSVVYALPPVPTLLAEWATDDGYTILTPTAPAPAAGEESVASIRVERASTEAGGWVVVAEGLSSGDTVTDPIPPTGTAVTYRAVTTSPIDTEAYSAGTVVETDTAWVFINYGPGFASVAKVWGNLKASRSYKPTKVIKRYAAGRVVARGGVAREESYDLGATLIAPWEIDDPDPGSSWDQIRDAVDAVTVCLRDPAGTRLFGTFTGTDLGEALEIHQSVSLPFVVTTAYREVAR